jgi:hypothetical protein
MQYIDSMPWTLVYLKEFVQWLESQEEDLQDEALAYLELLKERGPLLPRPYVDTLKGSKVANLKELRFDYRRDPIRILFAFDPNQQGVIILGGNKTGDKRWYRDNIPIAEQLFLAHVNSLKKEKRR